MAIIKCPECGKAVSDTASKCIHCGYEFSKELVDTSDKEIIILRRNRSVSYAGLILLGVFTVLFFFSGLRCFLTSKVLGCVYAWVLCASFLIGFIYSAILISSNNSCKDEVLTKKGNVYYAYSRSGERILLSKNRLSLIKFKKNYATYNSVYKVLGYIYPEDISKFKKELLS